jgi:hypothetical protein
MRFLCASIASDTVVAALKDDGWVAFLSHYNSSVVLVYDIERYTVNAVIERPAVLLRERIFGSNSCKRTAGGRSISGRPFY